MGREQSYREVFEKAPDAILIMRGDQFIDCNPAAARMLGFQSRSEMLGHVSQDGSRSGPTRHPADFSPARQPDGRLSYEKATENLAIAFERGTHTFEWTHVDAEGMHFEVEVQLTVVERGEKPLIHVVWRDISERKRLEAELRRSQRLEAIGRLAGGIAHDFNNLLVVVAGHAELLSEDIRAGRSPDGHHTEEIGKAVDRAAGLTQQLLSFSRGLPTQTVVTDLGVTLESLADLLQRLIGEHIELKLHRASGPNTVSADPTQLEQIVVNLAANARDAMEGGGKASISVGRQTLTEDSVSPRHTAGPYVLLKVEDSGEGMSHSQIERAFEPFYTTKSIGKGTGLGLATVHAIAEQSGGWVSIESSLGHGTKIQVWLPFVDEPPVDRSPTTPTSSEVGGSETILLVEDDAAIRELFEEVLKANGYRVHAAKDGQAGLDLARDSGSRIDLLVTDVIMPRLSGPELASRLSGSWPEIKVLFISGYSGENDVSRIEETKQATLLAKPLSPSALLVKVRDILDRV